MVEFFAVVLGIPLVLALCVAVFIAARWVWLKLNLGDIL